MAIGISSGISPAGGAGGFGLESQRAALATRRRESLETREEPATDPSARIEAEPSATAQRVSEGSAPREARQDRIRLSQVTDESQRPAIAAYLNVQRSTPSDPSLGELIGIDIYI